MPQRPAYNPEQIETKWQKRWMESGVFNAEFPSDKPKYYCLIEFPYPSGNGLHVGHPVPTRRWISSPASAAWRATTSFTPSGMTPSACLRKTSPSKTRFIPPW